MAILLPDELADLRQSASKDRVVDYSKAQINIALQAIEDWLEGNRVSLSNAINAATAPYVFTPAMKKRMFARWCRQKFGREGV